MNPIITMAAVSGFLGSAHCLGMCGTLVAAFTLAGRPSAVTGSPGARPSLAVGRQRPSGISFHLLYHAGRLTTYSLVGALVGWLGSTMPYTGAMGAAAGVIIVAADLLVIILGLATTGLFAVTFLRRLEGLAPVRIVTSFTLYLARHPSLFIAYPLGLTMGLIPCGLLYAMIVTAAQTGAADTAALVMLAFGLGTTPALLLFGAAAGLLGQQTRLWLIRAAGLAVTAMGIYNLVNHLDRLATTGAYIRCLCGG